MRSPGYRARRNSRPGHLVSDFIRQRSTTPLLRPNVCPFLIQSRGLIVPGSFAPPRPPRGPRTPRREAALPRSTSTVGIPVDDLAALLRRRRKELDRTARRRRCDRDLSDQPGPIAIADIRALLERLVRLLADRHAQT